jgi:hypothetical protein
MRNLSPFQRFLVVLFLAAVFFAAWHQLKESDSFYHLKAGQVIWETKSIPQADIFSFTAYGAPWVTHGWLAELLFYGVYSLGNALGVPGGGFGALTASVAALAAFTYFILLLTALRKGANLYVAFASLAALGALTFELWISRPQVCAFAAMALLLFFLEEFRRKQGTRALLGAVLTIWFWANVHASVPLGIVLILLYAGAELMKLRWEGWGAALPREALRRLAGAAGAAVAVSFVNPNSYDVFLYRLYVTEGVAQLGILEWKSIFNFLDRWQSVVFLALLGCSLATVLWWYSRRAARDATTLAVACAVAVLPVLSIRHVGWWPLAAAVPFAAALSGAGEGFLRRTSSRFLRRACAAALMLWLAFGIADAPRELVRRSTLPVGVADFIIAHGVEGPIFNLYNEGGYLIWRLWPAERVFVDGRSEVFAGAPFSELIRIVKRGRGWEETLLGKYGVNAAVLPYVPESLARDTGPLSGELVRRGFRLVHWDEVAMLLVRETSENRAFVAQNAFMSIHPLRDPRTIPPEERRQAGEEIQALLARAPESKNIQQYARDFLASH